MYRLNQIKLNIHHNENDLRLKIAKSISVSVDDIDWSTLIILHKAIDARDKKNILFVYNVAFDTKNVKVKLEKYEPIIFNPIVKANEGVGVNEGVGANFRSPRMGELCEPNVVSSIRPVVVGFGPAGIFAAYILALNGLKPIVVERGKSLEERAKDVEKFFDTMELDENSNVCFGEGGAGAFSDGKLNTNNKDKTGIYKFVLETFVKFGADGKILYENLPHIGTDKLVDVIKNIRNEIVRLGGEIYYNTKLTFEDGLAMLAPTNVGSQCVTPTDAGSQCVTLTDEGSQCIVPTIMKGAPVVLAIGNSSRDTFRELIANGFDIKAKPIAVGYRIAHRQIFINNAQYGGKSFDSKEGLAEFAPTKAGSQCVAPTKAGSQCVAHTRAGSQCVAPTNKVEKLLGPATYKLTYDTGDGHSVYSFCMCPGGYIINSSNFKGMLSINGMSYNDRNGKYANSAIVETVRPEDIEGLAELAHTGAGSQCVALTGTVFGPMGEDSPLKMIEFQERVEKAAFELEKGHIPYVTSDGNNICNEDVFKGQAKYCDKLKSVYENCGLKFDINKDIDEALNHFNKIIPGFFGAGSQSSPLQGLLKFAPTMSSFNSMNEESHHHYLIAGVETRTSSPVKLDRDENFMCNVPNFYPCGEGLGHGGGIMSCAVDGIRVARSIVERLKSI